MIKVVFAAFLVAPAYLIQRLLFYPAAYFFAFSYKTRAFLIKHFATSVASASWFVQVR